LAEEERGGFGEENVVGMSSRVKKGERGSRPKGRVKKRSGSFTEREWGSGMFKCRKGGGIGIFWGKKSGRRNRPKSRVVDWWT